MASSTERIAQMTQRHADQRASIILRLVKLLLGMWGGFDGWYDETLVDGQAARSAQMVDAANARARNLARSYMSSVLTEMGAAPEAIGKVIDSYPRIGVSSMAAYTRPARQFVYARSQGATIEEARLVATRRVEALATQDVKLADRDEAANVMAAAARNTRARKVTAFRRVIHPELSKTGTCGLCLVASQRVYRVGDLLPLHGPSCNCDTLPIVKGDDPGFRLNEDDLKSIYAAAGSTFADDLLNTRITINEHGELGPVLVKQGDNFRTAEDAGRPAYVKPTPASIREAQEAARDEVAEKLAAAQRRYDEMPSRDDGSPAAEKLAVFRAIKSMRDHLAALEAALRLSTT
jgi:hypothetical protein